MSFSMSFAATSAHGAHQKLREASAPAAVKALVELALAGLRWPQQATQGEGAGSMNDKAIASSGSSRKPTLVAVYVETYGHLEEGGSDRSWIDRFVVQPLYE